MSETGRPVKATLTSFRIIEALKAHDGAGVTELATELDLSKGAVHKHLNTLRDIGYVVKQDTTYRLSVSFLGLGVAARRRLQIYDVAATAVETLAESTGETASVMIPEHGYGVYICQATRTDTDLPHHEGERVTLHSTAGGKAILAYLPEEEIDEVLDRRGLPSRTPNTITDRGALAEELRAVRDRRIAYDREEHAEGWHCVASPLTDEANRAIGAVVISGSTEAMAEHATAADIPGLLLSTATSIENKLRSS